MSRYIVKAVATEAGVGRAEAKSVLVALNSVVVREVLAKGSFKVPSLVVVQKKIVKARQAGTKKVFGKEVQVGPKAASIKVVARPLKQLRDLLK
jgi:hypothetical protein